MTGNTRPKYSWPQLNKSWLFFFILFVALTLFAHRYLLHSFPLAYGDLSTFPRDYNQAFNEFFYAWRERGLGLYRSPGYLFQFIQGLFLLIFRVFSEAQLVFILLLHIAGYLSINYSLKKYLNFKGEFLTFIISIFYVYSPIMTGEFIGGTLYTTIFSFLLFPLIYFFTSDFYYKQNLFSGVKLFLTLGFIFAINPHMIVIYSISVLPCILVSLFMSLSNIKRWIPIGGILLFSMLFSPLYFLDTLGFIKTKNVNGVNSNFTNTIDSFLNDVHYTYSKSRFENVIRVGGFINPLGYSDNNRRFIPITLLIITMIIKKITSRKQKNIFIEVSLLSFVFVSGFIALTGYVLTDEIFLKFPVLFMFRNPSKLTMLSTFFLVIFMAEVINKFSFKSQRIRLIRNTFISLILLSYIWPITLGDRGLLSIAKNNYLFDKAVVNAASDLSKARGIETYPRSLWLPSSHEKTSIKLYWIDPYKLESEIGISQFSDTYYEETVAKKLSNKIITGDKLKSELNQDGIKYIVVISDKSDNISTSEVYGATSINSGSSIIIKTLESILLKKIVQTPEYSIYENNGYLPLFTSRFVDSECNFKIDCIDHKYSEVRNVKINSSKYIIHLKAGQSVKLRFNQSYHTEWVLTGSEDKILDEINSSHEKDGDYANSWIIPKSDNDLELILYFQPQTILQLSNLIGITTFITSILLLIKASKNERE